MLEVVTVWAPRPEHPKWRDYSDLLAMQAQTVKRAGHEHVVVTDVDLPGYRTLRTELPQPLLKALIGGQLAYLRTWSWDHRAVIVDIDCMIVGDLNRAFTGFDVGLTIREHPTQPIQNGVMYFEANMRAKIAGVKMLERTLELCGDGWGSDQEALATAVQPPLRHDVVPRFGAAFAFLSLERHNHPNKDASHRRLDKRVLIEHFKGDTKMQAANYVKELLGR